MYTRVLVYHVLNRSVGRATVFRDAADYAAFENLLLNAGELASVRLLTFCLMPNHWHLVLWQHAPAGQFGIDWPHGRGAGPGNLGPTATPQGIGTGIGHVLAEIRSLPHFFIV